MADISGSLTAILGLVAFLVGLAGFVLAIAGHSFGILAFLAGLMCGVVVGAAGMRLFVARRGSSLEEQRGYHWVEADYVYSIDGQSLHKHLQRVNITIRAIRDRVRTFSNQYRWSGSGPDSGPIVTSYGHTLATAPRRSLAWRAYDVTLEPSLQKGDEATISVVHELSDVNEEFESFLAKTVHEPLDRLLLRVELPLSMIPDKVWRITRAGSGPEAREVHRSLDESAEVKGDRLWIAWDIENPKSDRNYELSWTYIGFTDMYAAAVARRAGESSPGGI